MLRNQRFAASGERLQRLITELWKSYKPCEHPAEYLTVVDQQFIEIDDLVIDAQPEKFCRLCRRYAL